MHISAVEEQGDLHSVSTSCWLFVALSLLSSSNKYSPSPKALSISKNIETRSAYTIEVTTNDWIAITEFFYIYFLQYIFTANLNKSILIYI